MLLVLGVALWLLAGVACSWCGLKAARWCCLSLVWPCGCSLMFLVRPFGCSLVLLVLDVALRLLAGAVCSLCDFVAARAGS